MERCQQFFFFCSFKFADDPAQPVADSPAMAKHKLKFTAGMEGWGGGKAFQ